MKLFAKRYLRFMLPWLVLLMGLFGTGLAGYWVKLDIEQDEYRKFAFYCDEVRLKIAARLDAHKQTLLGGAALFDSSQVVKRQEWHNYVQRLRSDEHFNGIQGMGFSAWIPAWQLPGALLKAAAVLCRCRKHWAAAPPYYLIYLNKCRVMPSLTPPTQEIL